FFVGLCGPGAVLVLLLFNGVLLFELLKLPTCDAYASPVSCPKTPSPPIVSRTTFSPSTSPGTQEKIHPLQYFQTFDASILHSLVDLSLASSNLHVPGKK